MGKCESDDEIGTVRELSDIVWPYTPFSCPDALKFAAIFEVTLKTGTEEASGAVQLIGATLGGDNHRSHGTAILRRYIVHRVRFPS